MKKKMIIVLAGLLSVLLTACSSDKKEETTEIKVPASAKDLKKQHFEDVETRLRKAGFEKIEFKEEADLVTGWLTKEGEVEKVSIDGIADFKEADIFEKDAKVLITYHVFPEESSQSKNESEESTTKSTSTELEQKASDDSSLSKTTQTILETSEKEVSKKERTKKQESEKTEETITIQNNKEFAHIINDSSDYEAYKKFAKNYKGQKIEFDANIAYMNLHENKTTRYDFLIYAGNYSVDGSTGASGAPFQIRDKNVVSDFNFKGDNIPDSISEGLNIHLIAEVVDYDTRGDLLLITPVETRVR